MRESRWARTSFNDTFDAIELLLIDCANRFLGDSFLYNAVKHGLTAIDTDAKMKWTQGDGEQIPMLNGFVHGYLHKKIWYRLRLSTRPAAPPHGRRIAPIGFTREDVP